MRIQPPGGDNFRIPEPPDGGKGERVDGSKKASFDSKIDGAPQESAPLSALKGPQTEKLREILEGIDPNEPGAIEKATERIVDWTLTERFGEGFMNLKGAEGLREAVRNELANDPVGSSRIKSILEGL